MHNKEKLNKQLYSAIKNNELHKINSLIKSKADINCTDLKWKGTPLHVAIYQALKNENYSAKIALRLINAKADLTIKNALDSTPLYCAVQVPINLSVLEIIDALIKAKADANSMAKCFFGEKSILESAVDQAPIANTAKLKISVITKLLNAKANPHIYSKSGNLLHSAASKYSVKLIDVLIGAGLDPNCINKYGESPLDKADTERYDNNLLKRLLLFHPNIDQLFVDTCKKSELEIRHSSLMDMLLENEVKVLFTKYNGKTPIELLKCSYDLLKYSYKFIKSFQIKILTYIFSDLILSSDTRDNYLSLLLDESKTVQLFYLLNNPNSTEFQIVAELPNVERLDLFKESVKITKLRLAATAFMPGTSLFKAKCYIERVITCDSNFISVCKDSNYHVIKQLPEEINRLILSFTVISVFPIDFKPLNTYFLFNKVLKYYQELKPNITDLEKTTGKVAELILLTLFDKEVKPELGIL